MLIHLSKLCYILLILYYGWFQVVFFQISNFLLMLGASMIGLIVLHSLIRRGGLFDSFTIELFFWLLFAATSYIFGVFVAENYEFLHSSIMTFFEFLLLIFGIIYISKHDKKIDFFVNVFILYALICAITTVFWGVEYGQGRISMGTENNPNTLGITMVIGICCILYKINFQKLFVSIFYFNCILLLIYVCLLTGSRKSFLSILLVSIYWISLILVQYIKKAQFKQKVKCFVFIFLVIFAGYSLLFPLLEGSVLLERLSSLFKVGDYARESMYEMAFAYFKQSPLVGIGFNNYRAVSMFGTYSHSTYAEALACTGIIGCMLYFIPYFIILFNYLRLIISNKTDQNALRQAKVMFVLFGVLLFLGIGIIHFYEMESSIVFGMLIAFYKVNEKSLEYGVGKINTNVK